MAVMEVVFEFAGEDVESTRREGAVPRGRLSHLRGPAKLQIEAVV
jgi:hypothetical protein